MRFIRTVVALLLLGFCAVASAQERNIPFSLHAYADNSCGAWVKSQGDVLGRAQYLSWFRGFVSGYNFGNPSNQVVLGSLPSQETLVLYIDKFCHDNPLSPFIFAALKLVEELRERKE